MSLSITIKAPVLVFESSVAAITILYIFSFVLTSILLSIPKNFPNWFVPNCSRPLLNSGWNIIINAKTPQFIIAVKIALNIYKCSNLVRPVITIKIKIPFAN